MSSLFKLTSKPSFFVGKKLSSFTVRPSGGFFKILTKKQPPIIIPPYCSGCFFQTSASLSSPPPPGGAANSSIPPTIGYRFYNKNDAATKKYGKLVYAGPRDLKKKILPIKFVSISSSTMALGLQVFLFDKMDITAVAAMSTILTPVALVTVYLQHWMTKRFVYEMYHDETNDLYTAVVLNFWGFRKALTFHPDDLRPPMEKAMMCSVFVGARPLLLFRKYFVSEQAACEFGSIESGVAPDDLHDEKLKTENLHNRKEEDSIKTTEPPKRNSQHFVVDDVENEKIIEKRKMKQ